MIPVFDKSCAPPLDHFNNLLMSILSCGSQAQLANSTVGLYHWSVYAVSLVLVDAIGPI